MRTAIMVRYAAALLSLYSSTSFAMVYSWNDSGGIRHYANKQHDIPERYRAKAKALYPEESDMRPAGQNGSEQQRTGGAAANVQPLPQPSPVVVEVPAADGKTRKTRGATGKRGPRRDSESAD